MAGQSSTLSPEKLRSTCNQCAVSKVRCNKGKPTCQRCEAHQFECVYSRSRRRGKPRSSYQQRSIDGQSKSPQISSYDWSNSPFNDVGLDAFSEATTLLPENGVFDWRLWTDPNNILYGGNLENTPDGSTNDSAVVLEPQQRQPADSAVHMTFAPLDKSCQGETCTSTAFCALGKL
jgi:hypothetical protein